MLQSNDGHIDQLARQLDHISDQAFLVSALLVAIGAAWIGAGPERDKPVAQTP